MWNFTTKAVTYHCHHGSKWLNTKWQVQVCLITSLNIKHMWNISKELPHHVLSEIHKIMYFKQQGRPPYSPEVLRFSLIQRYTSRQAYSQLLEDFPLPSISLMRKLASGGIDPVKALQSLLKEDKVSKDAVILLDEMYLQKLCDYHGGGTQCR